MHSRGTGGQEIPPDDAGRPGERSGVPEPTDQALAAMANATRRAREVTGGVPLRPSTERASGRHVAQRPVFRRHAIGGRPLVGSGAAWESTDVAGGATTRPPRHRLRRSRLARSVGTGVALGLVIAGLIAALNLAVGSGSHPTATVRTSSHRPANSHPPTTVSTPPPTASPSSTTPVTQTTTAPPRTTVTTAAPAPPPLPRATSPAAPQLSAISPDGGGPGQLVTITGANLISSNGIVVASFNGELTRTVCPVTTACSVVVPNLGPAPGRAVVVVTTAQGTSNGLAFSYG